MSKAPYDSGVIKIFSIVKGYVTALIGNTTATINAALAGKAAASHSHSQSDVTGLADALAGKAAASHSHSQSDVTGLADALAGKAAASHSHSQSDVTGLADALAAKADAAATQTTLSAKQDTLTAGNNISIETVNDVLTISATDTTYSDATQQTHGLMSTADKTKLDSITAAKIQAWDAAEQNVNADWTAEGGDAQILHKPDLSVYALAANVTKSALGIDNVDNTSDADKPISTATQTALNGKQNVLTFDNAPAEQSENPVKSSGIYSALAGKISVSAKGANGGVAELDSNGKVPSSQLPSYVDDVLSYNSVSSFPATGEDGKIYIAKDTNLSYRWTGSEYGVISPSLALGNTSSTAYRGDWGAQDRAAIGTLTSLQTTAKSDLVAAINEIKNVLTFDSTPTENSTNPVTSGGVYTALAGKADATATQTALNAKQDALTAGDNVSIATVNGVLTISATDTTYPYKTNMVFDENYKEQFRTQTKGDAYSGGYISNIKVSGAGVDSAPQYGAGLAFGTSGTHGYINMNYSGDGFYVGGGSADKLKWTSRVYTTNYKPTKSDVGLGNVANLDQSSAIKNITRSGTTFTATKLDGTTFTFTQQDNNTTYSNATPSTNGSGGSAGLMSAADKEKLDKMVVIYAADYEAFDQNNPPDSNTIYFVLEASGS